MTDPLEELDKWCRKHYTVKIQLGPNVQPGDEGYIRLSNGYRSVTVHGHDECDANDPDNDYGYKYYTLREMIIKALEKWHADTTMKWFHVMVRTPERYPLPPKVETWTSYDTDDGVRVSDYFLVRVQAINEAEAVRLAPTYFPTNYGAAVSSVAEREAVKPEEMT